MKQSNATKIPSMLKLEIVEEFNTANITCKIKNNSYYSYFFLDTNKAIGHYRNRHHSLNNQTDLIFHYPVITDSKGIPFIFANDFILAIFEDIKYSQIVNNSMTIQDHARNTVLMLNYFFENESQFYGKGYLNFKFPRERKRPAFCYWQHLRYLIANSKISTNVARARQSSSIKFFEYAQRIGLIEREAELWSSKKTSISFSDAQKGNLIKQVTSPIHRIKPNHINKIPKTDTINDSGELRPMSKKEQNILFDSMAAVSPLWLRVLAYLSLVTGARLQSAATIREKQIMELLTKSDTTSPNYEITPYIQIGTPKSLVDTKNQKILRLYFDSNSIKFLEKYMLSSERKAALKKTKNNGLIFINPRDQHLFLRKQRLSPHYEIIVIQSA